jgi:hypothetical protein
MLSVLSRDLEKKAKKKSKKRKKGSLFNIRIPLPPPEGFL